MEHAILPFRNWEVQSVFEKFSMLRFYTVFNNFIYLFLPVGGSSLLRGLFSSCAKRALLSSCDAWAFHDGRFSCCGALAVGCAGFSSHGVRAQ